MLYLKEWDKNKFKLKAHFEKEEPKSYIEILSKITEIILNNKVIEIKEMFLEGVYQGDIEIEIKLADVELKTSVWYGTCSGCDTLQSIQDEESERVRISGYMMLSLHLMQKMTKK